MSDVNLGSVKAKLEVDASGVEDGISKATQALNGFSAAAVGMGAAIGVGFKIVEGAGELLQELANSALEAGRALAESVAQVAEFSKHLTNLSTVTGLSVDALQSIGKAAEESGASADSLINAVTRMEVKIGAGTKKVQESVSALGLSWKELAQSSPDEAFNKVAQSLVNMTDVAERNAVAQQLFGRSFQDVLPAMQAYLEAGDRYVNLSGAQIAAGLEMDHSLDELGTSWKELWQQIGATLNTPEVREGIKEIAQAIRNITIAVKDGSGPVAGFFKAIAEHANNAAKWVVFLGGAFDGLKERLASASKDTPGAIAAGMRALDAFEARVNADKNKQWGREMYPSLFEGEKPKLGSLGGGGDAAAAEVKKLQAEMERLSGAKAQAQIDLIAEAVRRLGLEGVADVDALGKQLITLGSQGAKVPEQLMGTWSKAFIEQASKVGSQGESLKKQIAVIYKDNSKSIRDALKNDEAAAKQYEQTRVFIDREAEQQIRAQLQNGTLSIKQEYAFRRADIVASTQLQIDKIKQMMAATAAAAAAASDPGTKTALESQLPVLQAQINVWEQITEKELRATVAAERYAQVASVFGKFGAILAGVADLFDAIGISADSAVGKIVSGMQEAVSAVQNFASQTTTAGKIGAGLSAAAGVYRTGQQKGATAGAASGALSGAGIGFQIGGVQGAAVGAVAGIVVGLVGALRKPEYKKIMNDVGKSWGVSISEGLAKEIEQIAKQNKVSRSMAELLDVSKIIGESGKDPREFTGKINDLMNAIKSGAVPAAQGLAELSKAFGMVADAALKSGNIGDKALVGLIKRARELGEVTPEMKDFIKGQLAGAVDGVQKLIEALPADTAAKAGSSGALLAATFNAMAAEQGIVAAAAALGPAYDQLMEQISKAGLAIPEALQSIGRQMELGKNPQFAAASNAAAATSQVLTGLGNAGYMDTAVLGASADVAKQAFDQAKSAGATDKEAYQAIGGLLSDIKNASIQSGQELSGVARELISGAQAEGVVIQGDQLSVLVDIRNILAGGSSAYATPGGGGGAGGGAEGGAAPGPDAGEGPGGPGSLPYTPRGAGRYAEFAEGSGGIQNFGAGTPAILHGREAVVTEKQMAGMGTSVSFHPTFNVDPLQSNEARSDLSKYQVEEFVRQVISNPLFQQILRDGGHR